MSCNNRREFELGVEPPPLEEFKRLVESLGPDSMFEDDAFMDDASIRAGIASEKRQQEVMRCLSCFIMCFFT